MTKVRELFRENLRSLRKAKGYSQRELSQKCDYTRSYVGQLERGEKDPSFESLIRLSDALGLSILDFFRNDKEGLEVELTEALEEMTNFSENNIRSLTTLPEIMDWDYRMVGLLNSKGRVLDFNRSAYEFMPETREEIIGNLIWNLTNQDRNNEYYQWLKRVVEVIQSDQKIYRGTFELAPGDSEPTEFEVTMTPIAVVGSQMDYIVIEGQRMDDIVETESYRDLPSA